MYQKLRRGGDEPISVHLCDFPEADPALIDENLMLGMDSVLEVVEQCHAARSKAGIKVRQPLAEMRIVIKAAQSIPKAEHIELIQDELNVKKIEFVTTVSDLYNVSVRLDARLGKPKYGRLFANLQADLERQSAPTVVERLSAGQNVALHAENRTVDLSPDEFIIERLGKNGWVISDGSGFIIAVNTLLDDTLIGEGLARDFIRHIQTLRKQIGLSVADRITIDYQSTDAVCRALSSNEKFITNETLANVINRSDLLLDSTQVFQLSGENVEVKLTKA
jgi:isoleucyl-tRNA synthetase